MHADALAEGEGEHGQGAGLLRGADEAGGEQFPGSPFDDLTSRERDVLALMAEGRSIAGIAGELVVSAPTVERHVTSIFGQLGPGQSDADQHRRVLAVLRHLQS